MPYHLSIEKYTNIKDHLDEEFSGLLGTGHNDWPHAVPAPLGRLIKVIGAGWAVPMQKWKTWLLVFSNTLDGVI